MPNWSSDNTKKPAMMSRMSVCAPNAIAPPTTVAVATKPPMLTPTSLMIVITATAQITPDGCVVWAPTQNPGGTQATAARIVGVPPDKVTVNTTLLGGGFGRRGEIDFIVDAVETAKAVGAPVKLMWTREDDIQHGFYRPATYNVFRAALDGGGMPVAWSHRIVGPGILAQKGRMPGNTTVDPAAVSGARDLPYDIPNLPSIAGIARARHQLRRSPRPPSAPISREMSQIGTTITAPTRK